MSFLSLPAPTYIISVADFPRMTVSTSSHIYYSESKLLYQKDLLGTLSPPV